MNNLSNTYKSLFKPWPGLPLILLLGLLVRMVFLLWGAELYFNRPSIFIDSDTGGWQRGFENLINLGVYTNNPAHELGFFARLPGYSLFMGFFWFLAGKDWQQAYVLIAWFQSLLDVVSIYLVFKITRKIFNERVALWSAALYALYPFIIVWNPVAYSESLSVFLMLAGFWFYISAGDNRWKYLLAGALLGLGVLMRPQVLIFSGVLGLGLLVKFRLSRAFLTRALFFGLGLLITYGPWPARNFLKYDSLVLTQDLRGLGRNWSPDAIAFMQYTFSVKSEWEPQFSSIIKNKPTTWPKQAYISTEDSLLLERAVWLSKHCGEGFSYWRGYWKEPVNPDEACTGEIAEIFNYLRERQIRENPWNFYVRVPLQNLRKAVFKTTLIYEPVTQLARQLSTYLFLYRTLMIFLGLAGVIFLIRERNVYGFIFLAYFAFLYLLLSAGTSVQMRNIEIRYFLHADVLLLIPAGYALQWIVEWFRKKPWQRTNPY